MAIGTGIPINTSFDINSPIPMDARTFMVDLTERDALPDIHRYEGLIVYVQSEGTNFQLVGGIDNVNWEELSGGGGGGGGEEFDDVGIIEAAVRDLDEPPEGCLPCDGEEYDATDPEYSTLAAHCWDTTTSKWKYGGTGTWPTGTFFAPKLEGQFLRGAAHGETTDPDRATRTASGTNGNTGDNVGSAQASQFGQHTHTQDSHTHLQAPHNHEVRVSRRATGVAASNETDYGYPIADKKDSSGGVTSYPTQMVGWPETATNTNTTATNQNSGGSETRPTNVTVNFFIRYQPSRTPRRGSHSFVGEGDPNDAIDLVPVPQTGDTWLDDLGNIWTYDFDTTTWTESLVNLMGPPGLNGGIPSVADLTALDAIDPGDRYEGMLVYVVSEGTNYQLIGGVDDTDWKVLAGGGIDVSAAVQQFAVTSTATLLPVQRQRIKVWTTVTGGVQLNLPDGTIDGQELFVQGIDDEYYCYILSANNVLSNGDIDFTQNVLQLYIWDAGSGLWITPKG